MGGQVDRLSLAGGCVRGKRRRRQLADVEEIEGEISSEDEDASDAVRQERVLCSCATHEYTSNACSVPYFNKLRRNVTDCDSNSHQVASV